MSAAGPTLRHLGVDFDNTVVLYDAVFHRRALARGLITPAVPARKQAVREAVRARPGGERAWTELQGEVYGTALGEAEAAPGVEGFLLACRQAGVRVSIVSHKTRFPVLGGRVDLRAAAHGWLEGRARLGIEPGDVVFTETLAEKLAEIGRRGFAAFVDDLPEVLAHPDFPAGVERILYARWGEAALPGVHAFPTWDAIRGHLLEGKP